MDHKYLSDFVYGGIDGTITTFAIVSGTAGANLSTNIIVILGLANVLADGFSMAVSRYLSAETEEELQDKPRDPSPYTSAIVTFFAFVVMGLIPLSAFILGHMMNSSGNKMYSLAYVLTGISLFLIGFLKGQMLGKHPGKSGLLTLGVGGAASLISFYVGRSLQHLGKGNLFVS